MRFEVVVLLLAVCSGTAAVRPPAGKWKATCMLVFGDSTVDPGNNNGLPDATKANFPPYGIDFSGRMATGRFCDGRLATDLISESLNISKIIPAFLDPKLTPEQLKHGVSFASASSGYDVLTSSNANVISLPKQIEYLLHYKIKLRRLFGPMKAEHIMKNAIVAISAGTNDIMWTYYLYPDRSKQFTMPKYTDYLISHLVNYTKEIHRQGPMRFVVVGIPPIGCLPIIKSFANSEKCVSKYNEVAIAMNTRLQAELGVMKKTLGLKTAYIDVYRSMIEAVKEPGKFGFLETSKGCCGTGTVEMGDTCKGQTTCKDPSKYMFFDAVHPTERMYRFIADEAVGRALRDIL